MKELQPINQNVLLELSEDKSVQTTASGIIIPDSAKEKQEVAKVVAISKDCSNRIDLKLAFRVLHILPKTFLKSTQKGRKLLPAFLHLF